VASTAGARFSYDTAGKERSAALAALFGIWFGRTGGVNG